MDWLTNPETWAALITLTALEVVLGIDNVIFISILAAKLPRHRQRLARRVGLMGAMITRILLLLSLAWIIRLTAPLFTVIGQEISGRDLMLIGGGLFLLAKATYEIHDKLEGAEGHASAKVKVSFPAVIFQIMLDSVITAVGMARHIGVMVAAVIAAVAVMMIAAEPISAFVDRHPTVKMLALSFLLLIGVSLLAEGFDQHVSKGYIYFAMGFSVFVEMLNLRMRAKAPPVHLLQRYAPEDG
jgi:predicted tellurium resistance membrane protein TerC